jgi:rubrerythrin
MSEVSTVKGVIALALEKEAEAEALYLKLAGLAGTGRATAIFEELAAEENKHYRALNNLDSNNLPDLAFKPAVDLKIGDHLKQPTFSPDMTYQEILILAMKNEAVAQQLYKDLAATAAGDPELVQLFEFLAGQEGRHKLRLETEYDEYVLTEG